MRRPFCLLDLSILNFSIIWEGRVNVVACASFGPVHIICHGSADSKRGRIPSREALEIIGRQDVRRDQEGDPARNRPCLVDRHRWLLEGFVFLGGKDGFGM